MNSFVIVLVLCVVKLSITEAGWPFSRSSSSSSGFNLDSYLDNLSKQIDETVNQINTNVQTQVTQLTDSIAFQQAAAQGQDGLTIAQSSDKTYIISNGQQYTCNGDVLYPSYSNGYIIGCSGDYVAVTVPDQCLAYQSSTTRSQYNNYVCYGDNITLTVINGSISCSGTLVDVRTLEAQCPGLQNGNYWTYTYRPNAGSSYAFPNANPYIGCSNSDYQTTGYCQLTRG